MAQLIALEPVKRAEVAAALEAHPNWPSPGITFLDFFPLFRQPRLIGDVMQAMEATVRAAYPGVTLIVGLESRGFLLAPQLAARLGVAFAPVRKAGKLPGDVARRSYKLEYGEAVFELQRAAVSASDRVVIVDDVLATGGTLNAAGQLVRELGGEVLGAVVLIEVAVLRGAAAAGMPCYTLLSM
jgi:adenine phosphoribosyltransferase